MTTRVSLRLAVVLLVSVYLCHPSHAEILLAPSTPTQCVLSRGSEGLEATCSGNDLIHIPDSLPPDLRKLRLVNTSLTTLQNGALSHIPELVNLDLSGNKLASLEPASLRGILSLRHLNLSHNLLCFDDDTFPEAVFFGMTSLRSLIAHSNYCPSGRGRYPDKALRELTGLETLTLNGLPDVPLGPGFAKMTSLNTLQLSGEHCHLGAVSGKTFASLQNTTVSHLSLRACNITKLSEDAFVPFSMLTSLNLACNSRVGLEDAMTAIREASTKSLDTVVLDDVSKTSEILNKRLFASVRFETVRRLSVRANDIVAVDVRSIYFLPELRTLATGFNLIHNGRVFFPTDTWVEILTNLSTTLKLDILDASHLVLNRTMYRRLFCGPDLVDTKDFFRAKPNLPGVDYKPTSGDAKQTNIGAVPLSLQAFFIDHAGYRRVHHSLPKVNITDSSNMVVANLSYTRLTKLKTSYVGYKNLQVLDASHCRIYRIYPGALGGLSNLKYLFLQHNVLGWLGDGITDQFHGLYALLELDLSYNMIPAIGADAFIDLANIRKLNLRENRLTILEFSISHMTSLVVVDVSSNLIAYGGSDFLDEGNVWENRKMQMSLTNNSFVCNCTSAAFVRWVQTTPINLTGKMDLQCVNETDHVVYIATLAGQSLPTPCPRRASTGVVVVAVCSLIAVFAVAVGLVCCRRRNDTKGSYRRFKVKVPM